jgi:hypothetical protein
VLALPDTIELCARSTRANDISDVSHRPALARPEQAGGCFIAVAPLVLDKVDAEGNLGGGRDLEGQDRDKMMASRPWSKIWFT